MGNKDELPAEVKSIIGSEIDLGWGADVVCQPVIRYWCEALEDGNQLYHDEKYARENGYSGVIAPPTMASTLSAPPLWPPKSKEMRILDMIPLDLQEGLVQSIEFEFHAPILVGDHLRAVERLANISTAKVTQVGTGHFVTIERLYYNQRGELVATRASTLFRYRRGSASKGQTK